VLEDQELPFCRLEEDLIGIVALDGPGNWLASRDQADNDFFALELGDKLRWALFRFFCHVRDLLFVLHVPTNLFANVGVSLFESLFQ
jgi:hypothetical protein